MSHASNKIKWCLKKAQKEIKGGKKHRGLIKKEADYDEIKKHIIKAEHNLSAVHYFSNGGFSDWAISAVFYCIYHCFLAIISKFGYESRNQECTISLIKYLNEKNKLNLNNKFMNALESYNEKDRHETNVIEKREFYTYGTSVSLGNKEELLNSIDLCKECLDKTKEIVFS